MAPTQTRLPDGRLVQLPEDTGQQLSVGVLVLASLKVAENESVAEATNKLGSALAQQYTGLLPSQIAGLTEARNLYKSFGMDPSRHRPSSEALLRRILRGKSLYSISNVVDACNLASLEFLLPVGMYDLDLVQGDIELRQGRLTEEYPGIRKGMVHLNGRLGIFDAEGPFGSPTSDSARTCTTEKTTTILALIMATDTYPTQKMAENISIFSDRFAEFCGAVETFRATLGGTA